MIHSEASVGGNRGPGQLKRTIPVKWRGETRRQGKGVQIEGPASLLEPTDFRTAVMADVHGNYQPRYRALYKQLDDQTIRR